MSASNARTSIPTKSTVYKDGWLCTGGPYQDYIEKLCHWCPGLEKADPENSSIPLASRQANATLLTVDDDHKYHRVLDMAFPKDLPVLADQFRTRIGLKNVWIISNINCDLVALLGEHFAMDPDFFLQYERSSKWRRWHYEPNLTPQLPSTVGSVRHHTLKYCDLRDLNPYFHSYNASCADTGRYIHRTKCNGVFESPSIVDRKCGFWYRTVQDGWDVVILCDPPLRAVHVWQPDDPARLDGRWYSRRIAIKDDKAFQGGYCDFIPRNDMLSHIPVGPTKISLSEDMCYYLVNHVDELPHRHLKEGYKTPLVLLQKLIASHYMQLVNFTTAHLIHKEWPLTRHESLADLEISWTEARWSEIQEVMMRCSEYVENLESLCISFGIPFEETGYSTNVDWWDTKADFQYILHRAKAIKWRTTDLNNAFTALTGIVGNAQAHQEARRSLVEAKRSVREAKNMKILTFVAMVFIPLAFTCALFSMNDKYNPGGTDFWVFFAVSVPLVILVFVGAFVANLGYNADGEWVWRTFGFGLKGAITTKSKDSVDAKNPVLTGEKPRPVTLVTAGTGSPSGDRYRKAKGV